jgi:hypothetical protein
LIGRTSKARRSTKKADGVIFLMISSAEKQITVDFPPLESAGARDATVLPGQGWFSSPVVDRTSYQG